MKHLHLIEEDRTHWARFDNRVGSYYTGSLKDGTQNYGINSHKVKEYRKRARKTKTWQRLLKAWYDPKVIYLQDTFHHRYCTEYIVLGADGMTDMKKTMDNLKKDFDYLNELMVNIGKPKLVWTDKLDSRKRRSSATKSSVSDEQILKEMLRKI